jgi:O-acetyl-ADP-ribose deacetylase (regulator of RNase III)
MLKHTKGDLLAMAEQGQFDIVVQGCNCFCTMGSGIARQIREQYPQAYAVDEATEAGSILKLGNFTTCLAGNVAEFIIVNAYTQFGFNKAGESNDVFEYASFELILQKLAEVYGDRDFGFPYIGMGLAGGDKQRIIGLLEWFTDLVNAKGGTVTLVEFGV